MIHGLSFRGRITRLEYFTGFFGVHIFLFLLLPFFFSTANTLSMLIAVFLMSIVFFCSLSATCRRINDAGGRWYLPLLPVAFYVVFCCVLVFVPSLVQPTTFFAFILAFGLVFLWNMVWVVRPSR